MSITFDTLKYTETLIQAGVDVTQAKAFANAQKETIAEVIDNSVATKMDLHELKSELKTDTQAIKQDIVVLKWMVGLVIVVNVLPILKTIL
jgi:hypothetical protein